MNLVKCPFCDKEIESDSFFCDQCGKELMACPVGHGFKKNKMCNECGRPLVSAKETASSAPQEKTPSPQQSPETVPQPQQIKESDIDFSSFGKIFGGAFKPQEENKEEVETHYVDTVVGKIKVKGKPKEDPAVSTENDKMPQTPESTVRPEMLPAVPQFLVNNTLNARLQLLDGAIIGRRAGNYVHIFGSQGYVSGTHARLQRNDTNVWEITDLDSTNGTFINGVRLAAHRSTPFKVGDTIAFYDLKFIVE